jgi:hypothetical protein
MTTAPRCNYLIFLSIGPKKQSAAAYRTIASADNMEAMA